MHHWVSVERDEILPVLHLRRIAPDELTHDEQPHYHPSQHSSRFGLAVDHEDIPKGDFFIVTQTLNKVGESRLCSFFSYYPGTITVVIFKLVVIVGDRGFP
jgi:hypothetical protein